MNKGVLLNDHSQDRLFYTATRGSVGCVSLV